MPLDAFNYTGKNFAPVKPLQEAKRTVSDDRFNASSHAAFFRELYQGLANENDTAWREVIEQARVISLLRSGKYTIKGDLTGTGYVFFKTISSKDRSNYPLFPQNSEILTSKWQKIKPTVNARNFAKGFRTAGQLKAVNTLVKSYFRDIFTNDYETREAYSAQDYGTYITQFEYDDTLNQMIQVVPIVKNESKVMVEGYGACYDCGFEGHPDAFQQTGAPIPQCPQCYENDKMSGFRTTKMVPDAISDQATITDFDSIKQGDIRGTLRDFAACRYDPRVFPHESAWFLHSERVPLRLMQQMFGEGIEYDTDQSAEYGFQVMDALSVRGGATEGNGADELFGSFERFHEETVLRSLWLKPEMYAGFKLKEPEQTLAGKIPADVPYEELFPNGICLRGFNDMRMQIGFYAEPARIASNVYLYQSHSGIGKGVDSAVDSAKDLNEVYSMAMAGLKRYGAAGLAIDKQSGLTNEDVRNLFRPQKAVFVDASQHGGDVNKMIMQMQPNPVNPVLPQMMIQLSNMMSMAFMSGDFAQGQVQDVDINTFGGQQLAHAKAEEQKGGILARKVSHRVLSAQHICDLHRQHIKIPRFYEYDSQGKTRGRLISGADVPEHLKFDAVPESEIPENKYEKRIATQEMIEKAGGIMALAQAAAADPRMTAWYTGQFGVELPMLDEEEIQLVCLSRLANILELSEMFPDPEQILASLDKKLYVREASHLLKSEFLMEILDDDEVDEWNPVARATVERLIERHRELEAEAQILDSQLMMRAQQQLMAEDAAFQQQLAAPQMDQQRQMQQEDQAMGMLADVGGRILDDEQAQVDADRAEEGKQADHQRQMELEKAKASLKPAPKPAATK